MLSSKSTSVNFHKICCWNLQIVEDIIGEWIKIGSSWWCKVQVHGAKIIYQVQNIHKYWQLPYTQC